MGIFGKKSASDEAIICTLLLTFAQSIEAVEKANQLVLNEAWDLFINTAGILTDGKIISETAMEMVVHQGKFPSNHELTLDLIGIRSRRSEAREFVDNNKRVLAQIFSVRNIANKENWNPKDFCEVLEQMTTRTFPSFGLEDSDSAFSAVIGIYMMALVSDLANDRSSMSTRVAKRVVGYEFALQWLADWNLVKKQA